MQPIALGYEIDKEKYPRVYDWMERVKNETQPFYDQAHAILLRLRNALSKSENSKL